MSPGAAPEPREPVFVFLPDRGELVAYASEDVAAAELSPWQEVGGIAAWNAGGGLVRFEVIRQRRRVLGVFHRGRDVVRVAEVERGGEHAEELRSALLASLERSGLDRGALERTTLSELVHVFGDPEARGRLRLAGEGRTLSAGVSMADEGAVEKAGVAPLKASVAEQLREKAELEGAARESRAAEAQRRAVLERHKADERAVATEHAGNKDAARRFRRQARGPRRPLSRGWVGVALGAGLLAILVLRKR